MKALTIWQPWASLIIAGAKPDDLTMATDQAGLRMQWES